VVPDALLTNGRPADSRLVDIGIDAVRFAGSLVGLRPLIHADALFLAEPHSARAANVRFPTAPII
jgi:hypothetical protein